MEYVTQETIDIAWFYKAKGYSNFSNPLRIVKSVADSEVIT